MYLLIVGGIAAGIGSAVLATYADEVMNWVSR
jgi:hypothetical protein